MSTPRTRMTGPVVMALSLMAELSSRDDLPVSLRVAIGLGREMLLDFRALPPPLLLVDSAEHHQALKQVIACLSRDSERYGAEVWRSRQAAELLRSYDDEVGLNADRVNPTRDG